MAVKNLVFRENWVGSNVTGMTGMKTFFVIFDLNWTHILAIKDPNKEFLKEHLS